MEEITFLVQGSSPDPYVVVFSRPDGVLTCFCNCKAGAVGGGCKHRLRILEGDSEGIVSGNADRVNDISQWLSGSAIESYMADVARAEAALEAAKKNVTAAKRRLAAACIGKQ